MVNKKFCLGMLLMIIVFGMSVVGCSNDAQIVAFEYAEGTSNVHVDTNQLSDSIIVFFDGVKNALSYDIYGQSKSTQEGIIPDIKYFSTIQANGYYSVGAVIAKSQLVPPAGLMGQTSISVNWRFGVTVTDIDKNHVPSKIVWSDYINITYTPDTTDMPKPPPSGSSQ